MAHIIHRTPSVGSVTKKMMEINPELTAREMADFIRKSISTQGDRSGEFAPAEVLNEANALRLAHESCYQGKSS